MKKCSTSSLFYIIGEQERTCKMQWLEVVKLLAELKHISGEKDPLLEPGTAKLLIVDGYYFTF